MDNVKNGALVLGALAFHDSSPAITIDKIFCKMFTIYLLSTCSKPWNDQN